MRVTPTARCLAALGLGLALPALAGVAAARPATSHVATTVLAVPSGLDPSEPHVAIDPQDPERLFAVAQLVVPRLGAPKEVLWRSRDGGATWQSSGLLGGVANERHGVSGDPVVAAGGAGLVLYGTLTFDPNRTSQTAAQAVGTRVSTDGGRSFTAFGTADQATLPLCLLEGSCEGPAPPGLFALDKPWLAVDTSSAAFRGSAYLVWVRVHFDTGDTELFIAASHDGGRSYGSPLLLQRSTAAELAGMEELAQVAVRPDGTVDAVWNGVRDGAPLILHASSTDGGATFSPPDVVAPLLPGGNRLGIVTSLAVSPSGRLAVCWSQAASPDHYDARVRCTVTDREGAWRPGFAILAGWRGRQYLPAAAFQGERLWVAAYVSTGHETRVVALPPEAGGAAQAVVLNSWPVSRRRICAPHPPNCRENQTFIGDYIGLVATADRVTAAYIAPSPDASQQNQVLASSFTPAG